MSENVIKELSARGVLEDDANEAIRLDDFVEAYDVGVSDVLEDLNLALDLREWSE